MPKYRIIANPIAGRGASYRHIAEVRTLMSDYSLDFDIVCTERPWHAAQLAEDAVTSGCQVVVALGGDGTVNEIVTAYHARQADRIGDAWHPLARGATIRVVGWESPRISRGCRALAERANRGFAGSQWPVSRSRIANAENAMSPLNAEDSVPRFLANAIAAVQRSSYYRLPMFGRVDGQPDAALSDSAMNGSGGGGS